MQVMNGILGKKIGMTQIYREDGTAVPVTVLQAGPCVVVQRKTGGKDGYEAVQIGLEDGSLRDGEWKANHPKHVNKPRRGHFAKAGVEPVRRLVEFVVAEDDASKAGDRFDVSIFEAGQYVDIVGKSKGRGFQGVMKRHGFRGGRASHGSMFHRAPGSIGQSADPSRVFPGMKAPGQMGDKRVTTKRLQIVEVKPEQNLLLVKGAVPGARNGMVQIRRSQG